MTIVCGSLEGKLRPNAGPRLDVPTNLAGRLELKPPRDAKHPWVCDVPLKVIYADLWEQLSLTTGPRRTLPPNDSRDTKTVNGAGAIRVDKP
jgi:hypothetical protein